jgi:hypothetical protein
MDHDKQPMSGKEKRGTPMRRKANSFSIAIAIAVAVCVWVLVPASASAAPPEITSTTFAAITGSSVILQAEINPKGKAVEYHFEYGPVDCAANPCTETAVKILPKGESPTPVSAQIIGLTPGTTYHFRVVAENGAKEVATSPDRIFATYATSGERLPDDRAYEQSSPVNKDGGDATGTFPLLKADLGGERITFLSTSGVPGGSGAQELPLYLASRGADWMTQGVLPPADLGQRARILGWTPDLAQFYATATKFGNPRTKTLLVRSSLDGSVATIAPYVAKGEYFFAGATPDGSEVVFESTAKLPSVDAAVDSVSNVYVWDQASDTLRLASVLNDGSAPINGSFGGSYDWVRGLTATSLAEGGAVRDYYTQDEHAISNTGDVYFTEGGTGQIYVRRNPTEEQSPIDINGKCTNLALACTTHVSASQKTNGKGLNNADAAGARPSAFMAASVDGSKAFFTSSEKLTNDATTGIEPAPPAIARAGTDGSSENLSFLPANAAGIAVDNTYLYWADPTTGTIGRATLDGTTEVRANFIEGAGKPQGVAVDAGHIYWTNDASGADGAGTIGRATLDGTTEVKADFITGASNPQGIAVDATHIYWANGGSANGTRGLGRADIDGSDADQSFAVNGEGNPADWDGIGLALDSTYIYFTSGSSGNIERIKLSEPKDFTSILFTGTADKFQGIAVNAGHIYWTNTATSAIGRAKLNNPQSNVTEVQPGFIENAGHPQGLAVDTGHTYWSANQGAEPNPGNDLYRYDAATGKLADLAVDNDQTNGVEVRGVLGVSHDGAYVYFAANGIPDGVSNSPNGRGETAMPGNCPDSLGSLSGTCNLYLWHEGQISFIARLDVGGDGFHTDAANWAATPTGVFVSELFRKTASVSTDGKTLLFRSQRQLDTYENDGTPEFYRYRAGEAAPRCVSCNPTGAAPTGAPSLGTLNTSSSVPARPASVLSRNLAAEGDRVFFQTTDALVEADKNGNAGCPQVGSLQQRFPACQDVYEWEANGAGTCSSESEGGGCLYLLSSGKSTYPSFFADASASGNDAFLFTRDRLVGQDRDELLDVYDARVKGGIAAQNPPPLNSCPSVEACHGAPPPLPAGATPSTSSFVGPGDPKPSRLRKHARHRKKNKHHHRATHRSTANRGAHP